jgi:hypothetical protein
MKVFIRIVPWLCMTCFWAAPLNLGELANAAGVNFDLQGVIDRRSPETDLIKRATPRSEKSKRRILSRGALIKS